MLKDEKPRILIFRNDLLEPSETFIAAQAAALERYEPVFAGLRRSRRSILPASAEAILLTDRDRLIDKSWRRFYLETGRAQKWTLALRKSKAVLMHAHFAVDGVSALPLAHQLQVPLIVTLHGYDVTTSDQTMARSFAGRLYLRRRQELFSRASLFLCVSSFIREEARQRGFPEHKLRLHSIGLDLSKFRPSHLPSCRPLVLFTGRLVEKKGCGYLLQAMQAVQREMPRAELCILGDGPLRSSLEQLAHRLGLRNTRFLGSQSADGVRAWLREARVFCVPSVRATNGDAEGLGMVFCEAQATGVPVASFQSGGIPEAVLDGKTGLLAPEGDSAALGRDILQLLRDRQLWERYSHAGQLHVREKFSLQQQTSQLEATYDEVIRGEELKPASRAS